MYKASISRFFCGGTPKGGITFYESWSDLYQHHPGADRAGGAGSKKQLGEDVELYSLQDPSVLADVREAGYVTTAPAARLIGMYMKAAEEGVDAMLNLCSSVGEVADSVQDVAKYIGVPIVRVDEEMCREAVRKGQRIGVMATLPTTLEPTKGTILRMAHECGKHVELVDCLVDCAFGLDQDQF